MTNYNHSVAVAIYIVYLSSLYALCKL